MLSEFKKHLITIEEHFDISFWADGRIRAGRRWENDILDAINQSEIVLLLLSPAYIASRYIREREIPAIASRIRAINGLICPVILKSCAWDAYVGELEAVPTRGRRLLPIADWIPQGKGYHQAREEIEAAIRSHFKLTPRSKRWFDPLMGLAEERDGPIWIEHGAQFDLDPSGSTGDVTAATQPITKQLHALNLQKAADFAAKITRLSNSLGRECEGVIPAARNLADILKRPTAELPDHIAPLWEASVRLASFLALDKRLLARPAGDQDPLPDDIHRAFDDLVGSVAPWVRRFPTARGLDDERGAYLANPLLFAMAVRVIQTAADAEVITPAAAAALNTNAQTAGMGGGQAAKASTYVIKGGRGLISRSASYAAGVLAGPGGSSHEEHLSMMDGIGRLLNQAESSVAGLVEDFPADIRQALARLMLRAGTPQFPHGNGDRDGPVNRGTASEKAVVSAATRLGLDPEDALYLDLTHGRVVIELLPDIAPMHVQQIKTLVRQGFYDGTVFHRVIEGFMAQGGDPTGTGTGGSDLDNIRAEFTDKAKFVRGTCGMARSQSPNSANSQFFIMFEPASHLNGQYTIWGQVVEGMELVDRIKRGSGGGGTVSNPDKIEKMSVAADAA